MLRAEHGFTVGHAEAQDALRAAEAAGVTDAKRFRCALRLVCCGRREELPAFERAFDAFFLAPQGLRQPHYSPRHSRPGRGPQEGDAERPADRTAGDPRDDGDEGGWGRGVRAVQDAGEPARSWAALLARYSAAVGRATAPAIPRDGLDAMLCAANRLISEAHLGRSRRWKPQERGARFDLRRTLRRSLHTGGDPVVLRRLGHPLRNPRFVLLIDGSRSMAEHGATMLQFAYALCQRTRRAAAFVFSTELRNVTRELRSPAGRDPQLPELGEAWGGGTRIGENLLAFVHGEGRRLLSDATVAIVISDGLDLGDVGPLARAMREIRRRSAAVIWVNPLAGTPGYVPSARGMHAALPHVTTFTSANEPAALGRLMRAAL
jgi:uncharacterized protein with von Willebrand factor type A (vWA) domain